MVRASAKRRPPSSSGATASSPYPDVRPTCPGSRATTRITAGTRLRPRRRADDRPSRRSPVQRRARPATRRARDRAELDACGIGFVADESGLDRAARSSSWRSPGSRACATAARSRPTASRATAPVLLPDPAAVLRPGRPAGARRATVDPTRLGVAFAFLDLDDDVGSQDGAGRPSPRRARPRASSSSAGATSRSTRRSSGAAALSDLPAHACRRILARPADIDDAEAERRAFRARRPRRGRAVAKQGVRHYFASWSFSTVTYKALVISDRLAAFYPDLTADDFAAPFVDLPQPLLDEHRAGVGARAAVPVPLPQRRDQHDRGQRAPDDSRGRARHRGGRARPRGAVPARSSTRTTPTPASSTPTLELLVRGGRDVRHAISMLIPEAWEGSRDLDPEVRDYFRYHACLTEPWDGPAGLIFTDGRRVGAALDRNGLRPLRWQRSEDGVVVCCSEAGAVPARRPRRDRSVAGSVPGRCCASIPTHPPASGPGRTTRRSRRSLAAARAVRRLGARRPGAVRLSATPIEMPPVARRARGASRSRSAATARRWRWSLKPMATDAKEPTFSMGDDTPFAAVAHAAAPGVQLPQAALRAGEQPADRPPARAPRDVAADVSRPASPAAHRGPGGGAACSSSPRSSSTPTRSTALLDRDALAVPPRRARRDLPDRRRPGRPRAAASTSSPTPALEAVAERCRRSSSSPTTPASTPNARPIPSLLALGAVHHRLVAERSAPRRRRSSSTPATRATPIPIACLLGYGADAVCPRVALRTVASDGRRRPARRGPLRRRRRRSSRPRSRTACSRSCRRWGSRPSTATAARRSSRRSGSRPRSSTRACAARRRRSAASGSRRSRADVLARHAAAFEPDAVARRAGVHPVPQARRRVPRQQPRRDRGAARVDRARRRRPPTPTAATSARAAPCGSGRRRRRQVRRPCRCAPPEEQGKVIFLDVRDAGRAAAAGRPGRASAPRTCSSARSPRAAPTSTTSSATSSRRVP